MKKESHWTSLFLLVLKVASPSAGNELFISSDFLLVLLSRVPFPSAPVHLLVSAQRSTLVPRVHFWLDSMKNSKSCKCAVYCFDVSAVGLCDFGRRQMWPRENSLSPDIVAGGDFSSCQQILFAVKTTKEPFLPDNGNSRSRLPNYKAELDWALSHQHSVCLPACRLNFGSQDSLFSH